MKEYTIHRTIITFAYDFSKPLEEYHDVISKCSTLKFDNMCKNDKFGSIFNLPIKLLPKSIKYIRTSFNFNSPIVLTKYVIGLEFNCYFDQELFLSQNIEYLSFGTYFDKQIVLPSKLKCLKFSDYFNQPIILPNKLIELELGRDYNQPIVLPNNLMYLRIGHCFKHNIVLPETLCDLIIDCNNYNIIDNLPNNLDNLCTGFMFFLPFDSLPNSIDNLIIYSNDYDCSVEHLKNYVSNISIGCDSDMV